MENDEIVKKIKKIGERGVVDEDVGKKKKNWVNNVTEDISKCEVIERMVKNSDM